MKYFKHESSNIETEDENIGDNTIIWAGVHVCKNVKIGKNCVLGENVYIGDGVTIGNCVKIQNNALVYRGVTVGNRVFIGPAVVTTNDCRPRSQGDWSHRFRETIIEDDVSIGASSTILCGITLAEGSEIGCGSLVLKSTKPWTMNFGSPATYQGDSPDKPEEAK